MAQKQLPLVSQPEIEDAERYRHVVDQKHRFCDKSSVGFFEVYGKQKGNFEELDTERLLAKLRTGACGESRRGKEDGGELRIRVLYVREFFFSSVLRLPNQTFLVNCSLSLHLIFNAIHSFLSFEKLNGKPTGKLKVTSDDLKELVERIGISKAFVQRMLEPQIWDGNNC